MLTNVRCILVFFYSTIVPKSLFGLQKIPIIDV